MRLLSRVLCLCKSEGVRAMCTSLARVAGRRISSKFAAVLAFRKKARILIRMNAGGCVSLPE